jgi:LysM repeat protein
MSHRPKRDPPDEQARPTSQSRARPRSARLLIGANLATGVFWAGMLWPLLAAASPPEVDPRFADLPSPEQLGEDVDDEGAGDADEPAPEPAVVDDEPAPEPESSPPEDDDDEAASESADASDEGDEGEDEVAKVEIKQLKKAKWIKHTIVPGERLDEIADRYKVRKGSLIRWNKLDKNKPRIYAGRDLAVYTKFIPPPQQKIIYTVQFGDTWPKIAKKYRVDADQLRHRWNPKVPRKFKAGQEIVIWIDPLDDPDLLRDTSQERATANAGTSSGSKAVGAAKAAAVKLPLAKIKSGSVSVGRPNRGRVVNSTALPENKKLYTVRKPDESYGSSHTLHNLQLAIANFRQATGYSGDLVIGAISKQGGGRLRPHSSHQSGRDVDIRLPLKRKGGSSDNMSDVDWDATWALIQALVSTGEIQYIFMSSSRQKQLYKAAKRAGASKDMIERIIQYPRKSGTNNGIVRHEKGHTAHIHVRFTCAANETRCESY